MPIAASLSVDLARPPRRELGLENVILPLDMSKWEHRQMGTIEVIGEADVRATLDLDQLRDALSVALIGIADGAVSVPPRVAASSPDGLLAAMPGYAPGLGLAAKLVTVFPENPRSGLPAHQAVIVVFDERTGTPVAIMGGTYITAMRTAMAAVIAAQALARPTSRSLAILGAGVQGASHLTAFTHLLSLSEIRVASRNFARATALAAEHSLAFAVPTFEEAVRDADIVCCCTDAREPVVVDDWIAPGAHVSSVGFGRELPSTTIARAEVFVEARAAVLPPPAGAAELQDRDPATVTEVGEVLAGRSPGRLSPDAVTVYKSTGHAAEDVAAAAVVLARARVLGIGSTVSLS